VFRQETEDVGIRFGSGLIAQGMRANFDRSLSSLPISHPDRFISRRCDGVQSLKEA
jgi:hypothetical protein